MMMIRDRSKTLKQESISGKFLTNWRPQIQNSCDPKGND